MEWELELSGAEVLAFALAVACAGLFVALFIMWTLPPRGTRGRDSTTELEQLRQSIGQLHGELGRLTDDINGRIDAKMRVLRSLLDAADAAIHELRQLRAPRIQSLAEVGEVSNLPVVRSPNLAGLETCPTSNETVMRATSEPIRAEPIAKSRDNTKTASPAAQPDLAEPPGRLDDRTERYSHVYSLADAGLDSAQISAETGMHRGEVELVLNLRRKKVRLDRSGRPEPAHVGSQLEEATV